VSHREDVIEAEKMRRSEQLNNKMNRVSTVFLQLKKLGVIVIAAAGVCVVDATAQEQIPADAMDGGAGQSLEQRILDRLAQGLDASALMSVYRGEQPLSPVRATSAADPEAFALSSEAAQVRQSLRTLRDALETARHELNEETFAQLKQAYLQAHASAMVMDHAFADVEERLAAANLATKLPRLEAVRTAVLKEFLALGALLEAFSSQEWEDIEAGEILAQANRDQSSSPQRRLEQIAVGAAPHFETLLREGAGAAITLRAATLPARARNLPARTPVTSPVITPVYALADATQSSVSAADTEPDPVDAPFDDEILAQAKALGHDYVRIFEYVRNTIRTEWYSGASHGALGALRLASGNDVDQASLLIALLRASGVPARYVHGVVELPVEQVAESLNLEDASFVPDALARAGVAHRAVVRGGRVAAVEVEHTWVAARVPYTNYRGALVDAAGKTWVPLAPSIKAWRNELPSGVLREVLAATSSAAWVESYLQQVHDEDFLADIRAKINAHLPQGGDYKAQLGSRMIEPQQAGVLPNSEPFKVIAVTGESPVLDDSRRNMVRIRLFAEPAATLPALDAALPLSTLAQQRLTLSYQPATLEDHRTTLLYGGMDLVPIYLIELRPALRLSGKQVAVGTATMNSGATARLEITLTNPAGSETVEQHLQTGAYHAFAIGNDVPSRGEIAASDTESEAARQLDGLGLAYTRAWSDAESELAALNATPLVRPFPGVVITSTAFAVEEVANVPHTLKWRGVTLDAALRITEPVGSETARRDWLRLSALQGSSLEHRIFEKQFEVDAVSADKGLALAADNLLSVNQGNVETTLAGLDLSENVKADLRQAVRFGYTIRLNAEKIQRNIWQGDAWWIEDPVTGSAGWYIAGKLAGGSSSEHPDNWLSFLAEAFASAHSPASNPNGLAGSGLVKLLDMQRGIVGQPLGRPLQVMALDQDNQPIKGAQVTFTVTRGGGKLAGGQSTATTMTNSLGVAEVSYTLGEATSDWPVFVDRNNSDQFSTQAGRNSIDAFVQTDKGPLRLDTPFTALGLPDKAVSLAQNGSVSGTGEANSVADTVILLATDKYGNPVANEDVMAMGLAPSVSEDCEEKPANPPSEATFIQATWPWACSSSLNGNTCGKSPETLKTDSSGATYFFVILGNSNKTDYPIIFTGAGTSVPYTFRSKGGCSDGPSVYITAFNVINNKGNILAATYPGAPYQRQLPITAYYSKPSKNGSSYLPDRTLVPVPSADVSLKISGGGGGSAWMQEAGQWFANLIPGYGPSFYQGSSVFENIEYEVDGQTKHIKKQTGPAPSIWGVAANIEEIRSLGVPAHLDETVVYLDNNGNTSYPLEITYRIQPSDYVASYVDVLIRDGASQLAYKGSSDKDIGKVQIERGVPFDLKRNYSVQMRVNPGSPEEVLSDTQDLLFQGKLIRYYTAQASMQTELDIANERSCNIVKHLNFSLNQEARITLTAKVNGSSSGSEVKLIDGVSYPAGESQFPLSPGVLLPRAEGYQFTLKAQSLSNATLVEEVKGEISVKLITNDALPVGQTLVKGVNVKSGRLIQAGQGFEYAGRGPQLAFQPMYSSADSGEPGVMGSNWTHNFDASLSTTSCGDVIVQTGDTGSMRFLQGHNGGYVPSKGYHGTLIENHADGSFDFYSKGGLRYHFVPIGMNDESKLSEIVDPNGNKLAFTYNPNGDLQQVKDGSGRTLDYKYEIRAFDGESRFALMRVTGSGGNTIALDYDDYGNIVSISRNGKAVQRFRYSQQDHWSRHLMTAFIDANGGVTDYGYDSREVDYTVPGFGGGVFKLPNGRVASIKTPDGGITRFAYTSNDANAPQTTSVTDPSGTTVYTTNKYGSVVKIDSPAGTTTMGWDSDKLYLMSRTEPGNITTNYEYDAAGNIVTENVAGFKTVTQWLIQGAPPYMKDRPLKTVDRNGNATEYQYDSAGNATQIDRPESVRLRNAYAANGDLLSATDGNGNTTRFNYDDYGLPAAQTDALGRRTVLSYDIRGRLVQTVDPRGAKTINAYDELDRPVRVTDAGGGIQTLEYDALGNKTAQVDAEGRRAEWTYDGMSRVLTQKTPLGTTSYTYDPAGNRKTETNARGELIATYEYDAANRLISRTEPGNAVTRYVYDAAGNLGSQTDALNRTTNIEYDALKRPVKVTDALGGVSETQYDGNGNTVAEIDALGQTTRHEYDGLDRRVRTVAADGGIHTAVYDKTDNLLTETDGEGNTRTYTYDEAGQRISARDALNQQSLFTYDAAGNLIKEINPRIKGRDYEYDKLNRPTLLRDEQKNVTRYAYDKAGNLLRETLPNGNVVEHTYDALNRKISSHDVLGSLGAWQYDADGNLLQETDANGIVAGRHKYDAFNRLVETRLAPLAGVTDRVLSFQYDEVSNLVLEKDALGNETEHVYDALNRRIRSKDALGTRAEADYDAVGNVIAERNGAGDETRHGYDALNRRILSEDALGTVWRGVYDKAGRLASENDANGIVTAYAYDGNGNKLTTTRDGVLLETLQYDPAGNLLFRTDARGTKEGFDYDDRNLVVSHNRPLASITAYKRDVMGDVIEERDPEGRFIVTTYDARRRALTVTVKGNETTTNAYDLNGNLVRTTQPLGNAVSTIYNADNQPEYITTETGTATLGYNANGLLTSRSDALGNTKTYVLDARSRREQVIQPDGTFETHGFDNADRLAETTDANGVIISYQYDVRSRELRRGYSASADGLSAVESEWDGNGNLLAKTVIDNDGRRVQQTEYDNFNRPEIVIDAYGNQLTHSYDANGNLTATTAPSVGGTGVTRYQYDVLNRLTQLQTGAELITYQYDRSGRVTQTAYPGGLTTLQNWDGAGRLAERSHQRNGTVLQRFTYRYDANGNRLEESRTQEGHNRVTTYQYDADDRLLAVSDSDGKSENYVLDANGNRLQIERSGHPRDNGVTTHAYDARGQVTATQTPTGSRSYVWDANGNLTEKHQDGKVHAYTWNALNQLLKAERDSATVSTYRYDPAGLRDQVNVGAAQTRTVWDNGFAFLTQDQSGRTLTRTEHTGDKALYLNGESGKEILLRDGLDSVTGTVAPGSGMLQSKTDYDAWGDSVRTGATQSKHGYTGHLDDTETGLTYARARYYDPEMGRFISRDPLEGIIDSPATWNPYLYGVSNPLKFTDPTGKLREIENTIEGFLAADAELAERAPDTKNSWELAKNISQRASLNLLAVGLSAINLAADTATVYGIGHSDRYEESYNSIGKTAAATVKTYDFFAHEQGLSKTHAMMVDNVSRLLEGDRRAASNVGNFFALLGAPGSGQKITNWSTRAVNATANKLAVRSLREWIPAGSTAIITEGELALNASLQLPTVFKYTKKVSSLATQDKAALAAMYFNRISIFNDFSYQTILKFDSIAQQAEFLSKYIPGVTTEHATAILQAASKRNSSAVFGGSRVRGDFKPNSDLDVGFGNLSEKQASRIIKQINKSGFNISLEELTIVPGKTTKTIQKIQTPEEFFQRSGIRDGGDLRKGEKYLPSGSVTVTPDGRVIINPPGIPANKILY